LFTALKLPTKLILICLCISAIHSGHSQNVKAYIEDGDRYLTKKNYQDAIQAFQKALDINPDDALVNFKLGSAYLYSDTKSKAAYFIDKAYRLNPYIDNKMDYNLGIALQNTNNFKQAIKHFEAFRKNNKQLAGLATIRIKQCILADSLLQYELNVEVENLGAPINTANGEYAPLIYPDGNTLLFTSNREVNRNGTHKEHIYASVKNNGTWEEPQKLANINTVQNDAAASLSADGKTMYIYSEIFAGDIFESKFDGHSWSKPTQLNKNINTKEYQETSACVSPDGKRLYFASNKPGGYGGLDIYMSTLEPNGEWGKAFNAGGMINTRGDDDSPFIHPDGVTLYFSSNGHPVIGNNDIFVSEFKNRKWTKPVNLGYPINSWEYDGFFSMSADKKTAYYATVKEGGMGGIDIYKAKFLEPKYKSQIKKAAPLADKPKNEDFKKNDFIDPSIKKLKEDKVVTILHGKVIDESDAHSLSASVSLIDNDSHKLLSKISSDPNSGEFELVIPHGGNYAVITERNGYLFNSLNFNLPKFNEYQEIDTHIIMTSLQTGGKSILKNIFFDNGKSDIKPQSTSELDKIIDLLNSSPTLRVQINGHTDNQGAAATNKALSLKRATTVVNYLIGKGVPASRVSAKGYGSERPIVSNDDEKDGREINRRTELEITSVGKQ
jgi:outer membrane protein OmpA-like peptidoglycan-associated protein/tetratricopeptide (TPR) repeat protein